MFEQLFIKYSMLKLRRQHETYKSIITARQGDFCSASAGLFCRRDPPADTTARECDVQIRSTPVRAKSEIMARYRDEGAHVLVSHQESILARHHTSLIMAGSDVEGCTGFRKIFRGMGRRFKEKIDANLCLG